MYCQTVFKVSIWIRVNCRSIVKLFCHTRIGLIILSTNYFQRQNFAHYKVLKLLIHEISLLHRLNYKNNIFLKAATYN